MAAELNKPVREGGMRRATQEGGIEELVVTSPAGKQGKMSQQVEAALKKY